MSSRIDVLVIDDSITDLKLLLDLMTLRDLRFSVARDGEQGLRQAFALTPGLVLLDIHMSGTDGFEVCRRLKAHATTSTVPVIFLTSSTDLETRLRGFAAGVVDYITKPFHESEVLARVGVHLELAARRLGVMRDASSPSPAQSLASEDDVLVVAAQRTLRSDIASPPSLESLARSVGCNRRRLNDAFQALCGQSVFAWLREERFRRAREMLRETNLPISTISDALGYSTPANFAKAFRERFAVTPSEMREEGDSPRPSPPIKRR